MFVGKRIKELMYLEVALTLDEYPLEEALDILQDIPDTRLEYNLDEALEIIFNGKDHISLKELKIFIRVILNLPESVYYLTLSKIQTKAN